jgi:hypothetical protein
MKRTTIMLPSELHERAVRYAARHRQSMGKVIREALDEHLLEADEKRDRDPFFADGFVFKGKAPRDGALNHDKYLYDDEP